MIHACGHSAHHFVEQPGLTEAKTVYQRMGANPCPMCAACESPAAYTIRPDGTIPRFTKEVSQAQELKQKARDLVSKAVKRRAVVIRRPRSASSCTPKRRLR